MLQFSFLSRTLVGAVLAVDSVVTLAGTGGRLCCFRVTRLVPSSAALVRVGPDTRMSIASVLAVTSQPTVSPQRLIPSSPATATPPAAKKASPWKTFKAVHSPNPPEVKESLNRTADTFALGVLESSSHSKQNEGLFELLQPPDRILWDAVSVQLAVRRRGEPLPAGAASRAVALVGSDCVSESACGVGGKGLASAMRLASAISSAGLASVSVTRVHIPSLLRDGPFDAMPARRLAAAFHLAEAVACQPPSASGAAPPAVPKECLAVLADCKSISTRVLPGKTLAEPQFGNAWLGMLVVDDLSPLSIATAGRSSLSPSALQLFLQLKEGLNRLCAIGIDSTSASNAGAVLVVGTAASMEAVDPTLLSPRCFGRDVPLDVPSFCERLAVLRTRSIVAPSVSAEQISESELQASAYASAGLAGTDLETACSQAALTALLRHSEAADQPVGVPVMRGQGLREAVLAVRSRLQAPTTDAAYRSATATLASGSQQIHKSWDTVGGMANVIRRLRQAVEAPLLHSAPHLRMGIRPPRGVLLYGPPGNSKTTLVRALAASLAATFLSVTGAEVYSAYVGEAERAVRDLFRRARGQQPSVVFLDEIDALVGSRGIGGSAEGRGW